MPLGPLSAPLILSHTANTTRFSLECTSPIAHMMHGSRAKNTSYPVHRYGRPMISVIAEPFVCTSRFRFFASSPTPAISSASRSSFSIRLASIKASTCSFSGYIATSRFAARSTAAMTACRNGCVADSSTPRAISTSRAGSTIIAQFPLIFAPSHACFVHFLKYAASSSLGVSVSRSAGAVRLTGQIAHAFSHVSLSSGPSAGTSAYTTLAITSA
mmetsp:Transcript_3116/g.11970  ORF Transcript_3116/g.11970 Transcript_3116/m.11970 type:complete len:215 (-) Transcript_3116:295-939(-)